MTRRKLSITYLGGPILLLDVDGEQFFTDPTFDPAGGQSRGGELNRLVKRIDRRSRQGRTLALNSSPE